MAGLLNKDEIRMKPLRDLAELIILQAMEDIWLPYSKRDAMLFFNGQGFVDCADMLGLTLYERRKVLEFVRTAYMSTIRMTRPNPSSFKVAYGLSPQQSQFQN